MTQIIAFPYKIRPNISHEFPAHLQTTAAKPDPLTLTSIPTKFLWIRTSLRRDEIYSLGKENNDPILTIIGRERSFQEFNSLTPYPRWPEHEKWRNSTNLRASFDYLKTRNRPL